MNTIKQLAAECALETAQIPRNIAPGRLPRAKSFMPAQSEAELIRGLKNAAYDPEETIRGLLARVSLLERQVTRLMRTNPAMPRRKGR